MEILVVPKKFCAVWHAAARLSKPFMHIASSLSLLKSA
jgi:hypothetical protein